MKKCLKVPQSFLSTQCATKSLALDDGSVLETCIHTMSDRGRMLFQQHVLVTVLAGKAVFSYGKQHYEVDAGKMLLVPRATSLTYHREDGADGSEFDSIMFCINDRLLGDFLSHAGGTPAVKDVSAGMRVYDMDDYMTAFCRSLHPYFKDPGKCSPGMLRLKVMELFYSLKEHNPGLFAQILQLRSPVRADIGQVVEENITSPVTVDELAYLSGRSLAAFKRDFKLAYNEPPAKFIRERRLQRAKDIIETSNESIADICYGLGFENPDHFSRIFKQRFGFAPSTLRNKRIL